VTAIRICFTGDSITLGTGDETTLGWPGRLGRAAWSQGHEDTVYNLGVRGETSADIRLRWRNEAARRLPSTMNWALVFAFQSERLCGGEQREAESSPGASVRRTPPFEGSGVRTVVTFPN